MMRLFGDGRKNEKIPFYAIGFQSMYVCTYVQYAHSSTHVYQSVNMKGQQQT
jgi:hypothetical protein